MCVCVCVCVCACCFDLLGVFFRLCVNLKDRVLVFGGISAQPNAEFIPPHLCILYCVYITILNCLCIPSVCMCVVVRHDELVLRTSTIL